jgi:hypothetical protein
MVYHWVLTFIVLKRLVVAKISKILAKPFLSKKIGRTAAFGGKTLQCLPLQGF